MMLNKNTIHSVSEPLETLGITHERPEETSPDAQRAVNVLAVSPHEDDHVSLRGILSHSSWQLCTARLWREAQAHLASRRFSVVVAEAELPDADWRRVLADLSKASDSPVLVVSSRAADERLWAEVLNLGAYDLLVKPFDPTEVSRVVGLAWLNWKHAMEAARKPLRHPDLALASGM
jgi:DNA-binding response OmpR family regulator